MADIAYPHDYLPMPLQDGYGFKPVSPLQRTETTSGRARQRRKYTSTPTVAIVECMKELGRKYMFVGYGKKFLRWIISRKTDLWYL